MPCTRPLHLNFRRPLPYLHLRQHWSLCPPVRVQQTAGNAQTPPSPSWHAVAALILVAVLWGSYPPALRYVFTLPDPPSPALLQAVQASVSFLLLQFWYLLSSRKVRPPPLPSSSLSPTSASSSFSLPSASSSLSSPQSSFTPKAPGTSLPLPPCVPSSLLPPALAHVPLLPRLLAQYPGLELGCWNFLGSAGAVVGLSTLPATKAAFLAQLTSLWVPVLAYLGGDRVAAAAWAGCALSALGGALVGLDQLPPGAVVDAAAVATDASGGVASIAAGSGGIAAGSEPEAAAQLAGVAFTLLACLFYALTTVRVGRYSSAFGTVEVARWASVAYACLSFVWLLLDSSGEQGAVQRVIELLSRPGCAAALLWAGTMPGALATVMQTFGQSRVSAPVAQVIFSSTPLWSSLMAALLPGGEGELLGRTGVMGAAVIASAALLAAAAESRTPQASR